MQWIYARVVVVSSFEVIHDGMRWEQTHLGGVVLSDSGAEIVHFNKPEKWNGEVIRGVVIRGVERIELKVGVHFT